jgi:tRNA (adenine37-N6)-methyltransferase
MALLLSLPLFKPRLMSIKTSSETIQFIGHVESCFIDKFGTPRQPGLVPESKAFLRLNPEWQPEDSLQGLESFSHLWLLFWFHKNSENSRFHAKIYPPRMAGEKVGVFSTRSPHRPNPIGLSLVKIEKVEKRGIWVSGVDVIEGTPIVDLKPYLPYAEAISDAQGGWTGNLETKPNIEVQFSCREKLEKWKQQRPEIESLVRQTLCLDPRPQVYKGFEGETSPYRSKHAVRLYEGDVHFEFLSPFKVEVFDIRFANDDIPDST